MKVLWTLEANQDRLDIQDYIAIDNPRAAARIDQLFVEAAAKPGTFRCWGASGKIPGTRELVPHENYRLIYEIDIADDAVWC